MNGAKALLIQAQTGEAKSKQQLAEAQAKNEPLKGAQIQAETGKDTAQAGEAGAQAALAKGKEAQLPEEDQRIKAQTKAYEAQATATPEKVQQGAQKLGQTQQAQLQRQAEAAWAARPLAVKAKDELTVSGDPHGEFIKNYIAMHSVPTGTPHTSASGKPIVMGPDGQYHYVNP
jgi:G3E family GTPase